MVCLFVMSECIIPGYTVDVHVHVVFNSNLVNMEAV